MVGKIEKYRYSAVGVQRLPPTCGKGRASYLFLTLCHPKAPPSTRAGPVIPATTASPIGSCPMTCSPPSTKFSWSGTLASSLLHSRLYQGCLEMKNHKPEWGISGPEYCFISWVDSYKLVTAARDLLRLSSEKGRAGPGGRLVDFQDVSLIFFF